MAKILKLDLSSSEKKQLRKLLDPSKTKTIAGSTITIAKKARETATL